MKYDKFEKEVYGDEKEKYYENTQTLTYEKLEGIVASKVRGSILWMVFGLLITGVTGFIFLNALYSGIIPYNLIMPLVYGVMILELVAVLAFTAMTYTAGPGTLKILFVIYSALTGITLSVIFLAYETSSIIYAFGGTVVLFAVLAAYGYITKEDLSKYTSILKAGLIALIVMSIINIFLRSDGLMWITSMLGVAVFIIFIAVDVNRIKNNVLYYAINEDMSIIDKVEIHGALSLYLDFINLFIYILRIIGRKK